MGAARAVVLGGPELDDSLLKQLQQHRAPPEVIATMRQRLEEARQESVFEVWPEHWHAVQVLSLSRTQWRVAAGMGGLLYLGLDYSALQPVLAATRHVKHAQPIERLLPTLQQLELYAASVLNKHH